MPVSPVFADTTVLADPTGSTAAPAKGAPDPKRPPAKAPRPDRAAVPTKKPAAVVAAVPEPGPLDLSITYVGELWQNNGGLKTGTDYMYGIDTSLTIDAQKLLGLQNAKIYIEGFYDGGDSLDVKYTGALAAPSGLDAFYSMNLLKLYQLYYEQRFGDTDILLGKYDVQTEFATTRPMNLFGNKAQAMNEAFLVGGALTGDNGPSVYPSTAVGLRIKQTFNDQWAVKLGLLDGEADSPDARSTTDVTFKDKYGILGIGEVDYTPAKLTKLMAGVWGNTGQFWKLGEYNSSSAPREAWGDMGAYVGGATRLYTIEANRGVDGFFNVGITDGDRNLMSKSFDAGLTFTGLIAARPNDKLGVAVAVAENSPGWKKFQLELGNHLSSYETALEVTYRARITDWLVVQPEVDYIVHPSVFGDAKNAFAYGLHFELHKEFN